MSRQLVAFTVAALTFGLAAGGSIVYQAMPDKEPRSCAAVREMVPRIFLIQSNLLSAVNARGDALDKDTYRAHDNDVRRFRKQLVAIEPQYNALYDSCEAAS